jgi:hypothetical protein
MGLKGAGAAFGPDVPVRAASTNGMLYPAIFVVYSTFYSDADDMSMILWSGTFDLSICSRTSCPARGKRTGNLVPAISYLCAPLQPLSRRADRFLRSGPDELVLVYLYFARLELKTIGNRAIGGAY